MSSFMVVVPCSTSNLGAGFDAIGIALGGPDLLVRATPRPGGLTISRLSGAGEDGLPRDATNRIIVAAHAAARLGGFDPAELCADLEVHSSIPLQRGLGSSAAAALAGALLADMLLGGKLGEECVLRAAVELEGHPDNIIPSLRGGAQVAIRDASGAVHSCPVRIGQPLRGALFIPDMTLPTSEARAVLPQSVSLGDAVHNLARAALFVAALAEGRTELFAEAMDDRLHQPARTRLIPWLPELIAAARKAGAYGAALSGAGSTVFALCPPDTVRDVAEAMGAAAAARGLTGRSEVVDVGVPGARIKSTE